ncbi:MAG: surface lipoprotein assembly modifier [Burkholderiaceae bacterium]
MKSVLVVLAGCGLAASVAAQPTPGTRLLSQLRVPAPSAPKVAPARTPLQALLRRAADQLRDGQSKAAYEALAARTGDYGGSPEFDYLLGIAALDAGHPGDAVLALERVLTVAPGHLQARAEIGRAYLALRERENARAAFRDVAASDIPPQARRLIGRYLDAIERLDEDQRVRWRGHASIEAGIDDNVNFGSASERWVLADGTAVTPLAVSLPERSALIGAAGGVDASGPLRAGWRWSASAQGAHTRYPSASAFNQSRLDLSVGASRPARCHQWNLLAQYQQIHLDGSHFRDATGATAQWQCAPSRSWQLGAWLQAFALRYPSQSVRDGSRQLVGAHVARTLPQWRDAIVLAAVHAGRERPSNGLSNLAFDFAGVRIGLDARASANWRASVTISFEDRRFDGPEPVFGATRHDRETSVRVAGQRELGKRWRISPALEFTRNRSTLAPNDFRRTRFVLSAAYRFE